MSTQLTLDFTPKPQREQRPIIKNEAWLDVSDIARGVGFTTAVQVNISLNDVLQPLQNEVGLFQFIGLQQRLEARLGCKVDLGTPRSLKPRIKEQVLQEAIRVA